MNGPSICSLFLLLASAVLATAQGTFVFDQQSNTNEALHWGTGSPLQTFTSPYGQSFTPSLPGVGFIRLKLYDDNTNNSLGATLYINLRAGSISGQIVAATDAVILPNGSGGPVDFMFSSPVTVTPGTTYYFEPVVQSGDFWKIDSNEYLYPGGTAWDNGLSFTGSDLWFREGTFVPEPSTAALLVLAATMLRFGLRR